MKRNGQMEAQGMRRAAIMIEGEVQGVGFRWTARHEAQSLGVGGFARNEADGSVYAEAEGAPEAVQAFIAWCGRGPFGASVSRVTTREIEPTGEREFGIRAY